MGGEAHHARSHVLLAILLAGCFFVTAARPLPSPEQLAYHEREVSMFM